MHSFSSVALDWEKLCHSPIIVLRQIISTLFFYVAYIRLSQPALGTVSLSPQQRVSHTPAANVSDTEIPPRSCTQRTVRRKERSKEGKEQRKGEGGKTKEKRNLLQQWQKLLKSGNENKGNCLCQKLATDEHKAWSKLWWLTDPYVIRICRTQRSLAAGTFAQLLEDGPCPGSLPPPAQYSHYWSATLQRAIGSPVSSFLKDIAKMFFSWKSHCESSCILGISFKYFLSLFISYFSALSV